MKVGREADVRGLGVTLWELLTRRRLFAEAEDEAQLSQLILGRDVPQLLSVDATLDRDLEAVVARATERVASDRIASAGQMADYLQMWLDGQSLPIRTPGMGEVVRKWVRQRPAVAGLLAALVVVTVLGVAGVLWKYFAAESQRREAVRQTTIAEAKEKKAKMAQKILARVFLLSDPDQPGETVSARQILDDAEKRIPLEFADESELQAELMATIAGVYAKLQANAPLAMILEAHGKFEVHLAKASPVASAPGVAAPGADATGLANKLLYHGDRLKLAADASVQLVVLRDLHKERIRPGTEAIIRRKGCDPTDVVSERSNEIVWTFAHLPKGMFYMGWDDAVSRQTKGVDTPIREDFEIACHPVTQGQWQALMGNNPSFSGASAEVDIKSRPFPTRS